jgi:hypothetical protein
MVLICENKLKMKLRVSEGVLCGKLNEGEESIA